MKNSELRDYNGTILTGLEKQRRLILREYSVPCPCPNCATEQSVFDAMGIDIDDYDMSEPGEKRVNCIGCGRELVLIVPFVKLAGPHWEWHLVPIKVPAE